MDPLYKYELTRREFAEQLAYMDSRNMEYAERAGGKEKLTGSELARFQGVEMRLIKLAAFMDAADDMIRELTSELTAAKNERNRLATELRETKGEHPLPPPIPFREYMAMMVLATKIPVHVGALLSDKEGRRQASRNALALQMPHLF